MHGKMYWIVLGGVAFWLPAILISAVFGVHDIWVALNIASIVGLILLGGLSWMTAKQMPRWGWILVGIYIFGPAAMLLASSFSHTQSSVGLPKERLFAVVLCLFPPMTLWMATLNGMIFSVLVVSIVLLLLSTRRTT